MYTDRHKVEYGIVLPLAQIYYIKGQSKTCTFTSLIIYWNPLIIVTVLIN